MNWKKNPTRLICVLVLGSLIVLPAMASAFVDVPNCSIVRIGVDYRLETVGVILDDLSDTFFPGARQFFISTDLGNQGLAVLLTAYSMGKTVFVRIEDDDLKPSSLISIIYVNP